MKIAAQIPLTPLVICTANDQDFIFLILSFLPLRPLRPLREAYIFERLRPKS
jgi:hypothetical protein